MKAPIILAAALFASPALAVDIPLRCPLTAKIHDKVLADPQGTWQPLPHNVFLFMQGVYYSAPPRGFPKGESAVLARLKDGFVVFFIDGPMACSPIPIPDDMVDALGKVANGEVFHDEEGSGL